MSGGNITVGSEDLGTGDPWEAILALRAERDDLRAVITEILAELDSHAGPWSTGSSRVKLARWRQRAGVA
jgi:hypothetical protein